MSTCIEKSYVFECAAHFDGKFMCNTFDMLLKMEIETDDIREQNIAIERMNYLLGYHIDSSIFIDQSCTKEIENYEKAGIKTVILPEEPYDQIVGLILMLKLNAIMEGRIVITEAIYGSKMSSGIKFNTSIDQALEMYKGKHWWNDASLNIRPAESKKDKDKVIKLRENNSWTELKLTWKESPK